MEIRYLHLYACDISTKRRKKPASIVILIFAFSRTRLRVWFKHKNGCELCFLSIPIIWRPNQQSSSNRNMWTFIPPFLFVRSRKKVSWSDFISFENVFRTKIIHLNEITESRLAHCARNVSSRETLDQSSWTKLILHQTVRIVPFVDISMCVLKFSYKSQYSLDENDSSVANNITPYCVSEDVDRKTKHDHQTTECQTSSNGMH